jgi:glycosyltransferase involved in cell wall biosynthesis
MNNFLICVVVAGYNVGKYLDRFFNSLISQTFQAFKIIFVYDKSGDDTYAVLLRFQKILGKEKLEIISNDKKRGLGAARNVGLDDGHFPDTCRYLSYLDPDDYVQPSYFASLFEAAEAHSSDITFCGFSRVDEDSKKVLSIDMVHNSNGEPLWRKRTDTFMFNPAVWNKMYRYSKIKDIRFDPIPRSEDVIYFVRCFHAIDTVYFVNEPLYMYSVRLGSLATTYSLGHFQPLRESYSHFVSSLSSGACEIDTYIGFAFLRVCIGAIIRIYQFDNKSLKPAIKESMAFMNATFPKWKKSRIFSFGYCKKLGKKAILLRWAKILFCSHLFGPFVRFYCFFIKRVKKEIRW